MVIGTRIGPYEVGERLGAGGMGEVYRARDEKLRRDVALKVLPATLAADPERRMRLLREAQILASLNHPSIACIYELVETNVLALVPGGVKISVLSPHGKRLCWRFWGLGSSSERDVWPAKLSA